MIAAVTGASGHLGGAVVRALLERGAEVWALVHRDRRALVGLSVELRDGDVADPGSLLRAFAGADVVFHLAALIPITGGQRGKVEATNVAGARNVAEAARLAGVARLVHVSSVHAFASRPDVPLHEACPRVGPDAPAYDRSKAAGEVAVREAAGPLPVVILNPTGIVGPFDFKPSRMGRSLLLMARGHFPALAPGGFDWVDVRDAAASVVAAAERGRPGECYLLGGRWHSVREIAGMVAAAGGAAPPRLTTPWWLARLSALPAPAVAGLLGREPLFTPEALHALRSGSRQVVWEKAARAARPRPAADRRLRP